MGRNTIGTFENVPTLSLREKDGAPTLTNELEEDQGDGGREE